VRSWLWGLKTTCFIGRRMDPRRGSRRSLAREIGGECSGSPILAPLPLIDPVPQRTHITLTPLKGGCLILLEGSVEGPGAGEMAMFWVGQGVLQVPREGDEPLYRQHAQRVKPPRFPIHVALSTKILLFRYSTGLAL